MDRNKQLLEIVRETQKNPCLSNNLRKTTRVISRFYDEALKPLGIKGTQYTLLNVVAGRQPINFNEIANLTYSDKTTIARNLKLLELKGLVRFEVGKDKREREVYLMKKGEEMLLRAYPLWKGAQERMKEILGNKNVHQLLCQLTLTLEDAVRE